MKTETDSMYVGSYATLACCKEAQGGTSEGRAASEVRRCRGAGTSFPTSFPDLGAKQVRDDDEETGRPQARLA